MLEDDYRYELYASLYQHLRDDDFPGGKTKAQKIAKKVKEHFQLDELLYDVNKPIRQIINLYENKDTQELKEYVVEWDDDLLHETLRLFVLSDTYYKLKKVPPRECKSKNAQCDFCDICFR